MSEAGGEEAATDERVVADFVGEFYVSDMDGENPVPGRIVMSRKRLVLAGERRRETIPTDAMFDVAVGQVPAGMQAFFSDSVTVAYEVDGSRRTAIVEAGSDTIEKFTHVLFKAHLTGRTVTVEHPARRGGRVVDTPARRARLSVGDRRLAFEGAGVEFAVDLATVTNFQRGRRTLDGDARPVMSVRHVPGTTALVSVVALPSGRVMNLLGRYLRLEYTDLVEELSAVDLSEEELETLVAVYSTDDAVDPLDVVTGDASRATVVLNRLREKDLVVDAEDGPSLTASGRIVVNSRLEAVND
jgi:helix-turn-helix protein